MHNPYANVDFQNVIHVPSANHWHCGKTSSFLAMHYAGLKHFALTNYQPAYPTYPLVGNRYFTITAGEIPEDIIASPSSEKVFFADAGMHISCPGSLAETYGHNLPEGEPKIPWRDKFALVFEGLQYEDAGGIIINHPVRSGNTPEFIIEKLLYDSRVLGLEVYNHRSHRDYGEKGYAFDKWDSILSRGYKCFGFCTPDEHTVPEGYIAGDDMRDANFGLGRNVLLVPEMTEYEALKVYRNGSFYGAYYGDRIKFTRIECVGDKVYFETDLAEKIDLISYSLQGKEIVANPVISVTGSAAEFTVDDTTIFVRAVAHEDATTSIFDQPITGEKLFSQPILFKSYADIEREKMYLKVDTKIGHNGELADVEFKTWVNGSWKNVDFIR